MKHCPTLKFKATWKKLIDILFINGVQVVFYKKLVKGSSTDRPPDCGPLCKQPMRRLKAKRLFRASHIKYLLLLLL